MVLILQLLAKEKNVVGWQNGRGSLLLYTGGSTDLKLQTFRIRSNLGLQYSNRCSCSSLQDQNCPAPQDQL